MTTIAPCPKTEHEVAAFDYLGYLVNIYRPSPKARCRVIIKTAQKLTYDLETPPSSDLERVTDYVRAVINARVARDTARAQREAAERIEKDSTETLNALLYRAAIGFRP